MIPNDTLIGLLHDRAQDVIYTRSTEDYLDQTTETQNVQPLCGLTELINSCKLTVHHRKDLDGHRHLMSLLLISGYTVHAVEVDIEDEGEFVCEL
jgi:hypothetical protein